MMMKGFGGFPWDLVALKLVLIVLLYQQDNNGVSAFGGRCYSKHHGHHHHHHNLKKKDGRGVLPFSSSCGSPITKTVLETSYTFRKKQSSALFVASATTGSEGALQLLEEAAAAAEVISQLPTPTKKKTTRRRKWEESYNLLLEYHKEHGHANVPYGYKKDPKLGIWTRNQRNRRCSLPPHKVAKLDALGLIWESPKERKNQLKWDTMFQTLLEYKEVHGNCNVPRRYEDNPKLARWVQNQRKFYRDNLLSSHRIDKLNSIGFVWRQRAYTTRGPNKDLWQQRYQELLEYKQQHGHCKVPQNYPENPSLGKWVTTQRVCLLENRLDGKRKELLDSIEFIWGFEAQREQQWMSKYQQLKQFILATTCNNGKQQQRQQRNKGVSVTPCEMELWHWEKFQQDRYMTGTLNPKRQSLLEEIGYWDLLGLTPQQNNKTPTRGKQATTIGAV